MLWFKPRVVRSMTWPAVREKHLANHPACIVCGTTIKVEAHHVVPVHVDRARELDPSNLVTLCRRFGGGHHLDFGHLGNWKRQNPCVIEAARLAREG